MTDYPQNYVSLIGQARVNPEDADTFAAYAAKSLEPTRAIKGCLSYSIARDIADPGLFHIVEDWTSKEALFEHVNSPEFKKQIEGASEQKLLSRDMYLADASNRYLAS